MAGNLVNNNRTTRTYNAANQMVNDGTNGLTYDANGNLTNDGVNAYTWDRANRMLTAPGSTSYKYDGLGHRIQQTVSSVVTNYLNDIQPGLVKLLRQDDGSNVDHFVHAPRGIHAVDDGTDWTWFAQDGLGSVRGLVDDGADVVSSQSYNPYGVPDSDYGAGFGFTGEQTDENDNIYLRARYMNPNMGTFLSLDPFEGMIDEVMSINGYSYVSGNVVNIVDPSGMIDENPAIWDTCQEGVSVAQALPIDVLIQNITSNYPVRLIERGLDANVQQIQSPVNEQQHRSVLENLLDALEDMDSKFALIGSDLSDIFNQDEYLDIALDYFGRDSDRSGITPRDIPNRMRLGNRMVTEHIVHEWGHAINRKDGFVHSSYLATNGIRTYLSIPRMLTISIVGQSTETQITGLSSCLPVPVTEPIEKPAEFGGGDLSQRLLSGFPPGSGAYQRCLVGYGDIANPDIDPEEDWPDMFMNWVYSNSIKGGNAGFSKAGPSERQKMFASVRGAWMRVYMRDNF